MNKKSGHIKFIVGLLTIVLVLGAIICGGYFVLDKAVVPKYFASYGIHSMDDLVVMMQTLYDVPTESELVENGYSKSDLSTATNKLTDRQYPILQDGTFDFEAFDSGQRGIGDLYMTDRELASIIDKLLDSTEFSDILPNLNHIDTINMNLLELSITPQTLEGDIDTQNAHIKFVLKIDTTEVRSQMAKEMDIPIFLLNIQSITFIVTSVSWSPIHETAPRFSSNKQFCTICSANEVLLLTLEEKAAILLDGCTPTFFLNIVFVIVHSAS